jgi:hypothetical protein
MVTETACPENSLERGDILKTLTGSDKTFSTVNYSKNALYHNERPKNIRGFLRLFLNHILTVLTRTQLLNL